VESGIITFHLRGAARAFGGFHHLPPGDGVGIVNVRYSPVKALAFIGRKLIEERTVGCNSFKKFSHRAQFQSSTFYGHHKIPLPLLSVTVQ
jgi:hypothetical protein